MILIAYEIVPIGLGLIDYELVNCIRLTLIAELVSVLTLKAELVSVLTLIADGLYLGLRSPYGIGHLLQRFPVVFF